MAELKPCPFCRGAAVPSKISIGTDWEAIAIVCVSCAIRTRDHKDRDNAVREWNRRAEPPVLDCRRCGGKNVRVYELDGLPVVECSSCCATWNLEAPHA